MPDLNKLLLLADQKGLLLNNLFQIRRDSWRCNLRTTDSKTTSYGTGATAEEALHLAITEAECLTKPKSRADDLLS